MPVPGHRSDCQTRIWGGHCPDCSDPVFFFSCSCGSRVYFDEPEPPWPQHRERCIHYLVRCLREEGIALTEIANTVEEFATRQSLEVPSEVLRLLRPNRRQGQRPQAIVNVEPDVSSATELQGTVILLDRNVNFHKRAKLPINEMANQILGDLAKIPHNEIVVRENSEDMLVSQVKCFVSVDECESIRLTVGNTVEVELETKVIPNYGHAWFAADIRLC